MANSTIWRFVTETSDRYRWDTAAIENFSEEVARLSRSLALQLRSEFDEELGVEATSYPDVLLVKVALQIRIPTVGEPAVSRKELNALIREVGAEIQAGERRVFKPSIFCAAAVELRLCSLAHPGETADMPSLRSRVGIAMVSAVGKRFDGIRVQMRGRLRHRRYILTRDVRPSALGADFIVLKDRPLPSSDKSTEDRVAVERY